MLKPLNKRHGKTLQSNCWFFMQQSSSRNTWSAVQVEQAKQMLEQDYVSKAKKKSAKQRIEVVRFTTDPSSIGEVVVTRAEELNATAVVG